MVAHVRFVSARNDAERPKRRAMRRVRRAVRRPAQLNFMRRTSMSNADEPVGPLADDLEMPSLSISRGHLDPEAVGHLARPLRLR